MITRSVQTKAKKANQGDYYSDRQIVEKRRARKHDETRQKREQNRTLLD